MEATPREPHEVAKVELRTRKLSTPELTSIAWPPNAPVVKSSRPSIAHTSSNDREASKRLPIDLFATQWTPTAPPRSQNGSRIEVRYEQTLNPRGVVDVGAISTRRRKPRRRAHPFGYIFETCSAIWASGAHNESEYAGSPTTCELCGPQKPGPLLKTRRGGICRLQNNIAYYTYYSCFSLTRI